MSAHCKHYRGETDEGRCMECGVAYSELYHEAHTHLVEAKALLMAAMPSIPPGADEMAGARWYLRRAALYRRLP